MMRHLGIYVGTTTLGDEGKINHRVKESMNPRAVLVAAAVADSGLVDVEIDGNILAATYKSWMNNGRGDYYTRIDSEYNTAYGDPTGFQYDVRSFGNPCDFLPRWGQAPKRKIDNGATTGIPYSGVLYPRATNLNPPPIDTLT